MCAGKLDTIVIQNIARGWIGARIMWKIDMVK